MSIDVTGQGRHGIEMPRNNGVRVDEKAFDIVLQADQQLHGGQRIQPQVITQVRVGRDDRAFR
ncbi:hypothetical protein D3C76_1359340 [compost metagenome]